MCRAMVVSQLPLDVVGGGELFTINSFRQLQSVAAHVELWYATRPQPQLASHVERMGHPFTQGILEGERVVAGKQLSLKDLLMRSASYDFFAVHQYLSCSSTMDWVTTMSPSQRLVLTSLGHEAFAQEFCRVFESATNVLVAEISNYAAQRSLERGIAAIGVCGGIYAREIRDLQVSEFDATAQPNAVAIGRLLPHKGFDITVQAMPKNWNLKLIGPSSGAAIYERYLNELIKSHTHVTLNGYVSQEERDGLIRQAEALVASSCTTLFDGKKIEQAELFGLVLLEAIAQGTIPIASDIPSFGEVMHQMGLDRWLYPQRDSEALSRCLGQLSQLTPCGYVEEVRAAQKLLRQNYLWDDYWPKIFDQFGMKVDSSEATVSFQQRLAA